VEAFGGDPRRPILLLTPKANTDGVRWEEGREGGREGMKEGEKFGRLTFPCFPVLIYLQGAAFAFHRLGGRCSRQQQQQQEEAEGRDDKKWHEAGREGGREGRKKGA